jgi:flagellin-like protein
MGIQDNRAQSEVIGSLLLVALVIVSVTFAGGVAVANYSNQTSDGPLFECEIEYADDVIKVTHQGGDSAPTSQLTTVLRNDTSQSVPFTDIEGDEDDQFDPGESATFGSLSSETDVLVVTTNEIVCQTTIDPGE